MSSGFRSRSAEEFGPCPKSEIETRNSKQNQRPKSEAQNRAVSRRFEPSSFQVLNLFRFRFRLQFVVPQRAGDPVLDLCLS